MSLCTWAGQQGSTRWVGGWVGGCPPAGVAGPAGAACSIAELTGPAAMSNCSEVLRKRCSCGHNSAEQQSELMHAALSLLTPVLSPVGAPLQLQANVCSVLMLAVWSLGEVRLGCSRPGAVSQGSARLHTLPSARSRHLRAASASAAR